MRQFAVCVLLASLVFPDLEAAQPVRARKAMVVSREENATDAGVAVLRAGGNAIDAAVAVGFALAVTHPSAGNIGGGGFMLIRFADGRTTFLDFRERAPLKATRDMYLDKDGNPTRDSVLGWRAAGVPGTVRGLEYAHRKYGRAKWERTVAPAVKLARAGFPVSWGLAQSLRNSKNLAEFAESKRIFQKGGAFYEPGDVLVQPELAKVLERIQRFGGKDFYEGETARLLAAQMARNGGEISLEDLRQYQVAERKPLESKFRERYSIITAPPPSSGGIGILQMLNVLESTGYEKHGAGSAQAIHFTAEAMRRYYADRAEHLGDPDFWNVPVSKLLHSNYVKKIRDSIDPEKATPSDSVKAGDIRSMESAETTHYSIVDAEGNAVAVTYTLNGGYGSGVTVPGLGILLNNEMDDFSVKPGHPNMFGALGGEANAIQPKKRPLSSMSPTIVLKDGKPFLVVGTPGGTRILTSVMQVIQNVIDFKMNVQDAVNFPRFHHQWRPDKLYLETQFSPDTLRILTAKGHALEQATRICEIAAIQFEEKGWLAGAADPRVEGKAAGYEMIHALSTHLFLNHRLTTASLDKIFDAGVSAVEIFCGRQHLDYHNRAQIDELTHWFRDSELKLHSLHSPMYNDDVNGRSGPQAIVNIADVVKARRIAACDEIKRALEIAERIPFRYLIQHLGAPVDEYDDRKLEAAFSSLDELRLFAKHRGVEVLLENIPNGLSSAEKLNLFLGQTHLDLGFCFDTGHAHIMGGVVSEFEQMRHRVRSLHVHDNDGKRDTHWFPTLHPGGSIDWRTVMPLLRERQHQYPLLLEIKESPDFPQPLESVRKIFDNLESH